MKNILNLKLVIYLEYQNIKIFLPFLTDLIGKEIFGTFYENELQKKKKNNNNE